MVGSVPRRVFEQVGCGTAAFPLDPARRLGPWLPAIGMRYGPIGGLRDRSSGARPVLHELLILLVILIDKLRHIEDGVAKRRKSGVAVRTIWRHRISVPICPKGLDRLPHVVGPRLRRD